MVEPNLLTWPGYDKDRSDAVVFHLIRALQIVAAAKPADGGAAGYDRLRSLGVASDHARMARGYMGAIGFERKSRLVF